MLLRLEEPVAKPLFERFGLLLVARFVKFRGADPTQDIFEHCAKFRGLDEFW